MESIVDLAGVGGAIVVSMVLALGLEWLSLRGLMLLMPPAKVAPVAVVVTASSNGGQRKAA